MTLAATQKIVITGATGNLGSKIRRHLASKNRYRLLLIDKEPQGDPSIIKADLRVYDESWTACFDNAYVVIHLAAEAHHNASWKSLERINIDAVFNVFEAAVEKATRRVIFASSIQTMFGYLPNNVSISSDLPAHPVNYYGASKVMAERLGKNFSERHGLSTINLRLGWNQKGENQPGVHMGSPEKQQMWLSNRDFCQGVEKAVLAQDVPFAILNLLSNNEGMSWDLSETRRVLGYVPEDSHIPVTLPFYPRVKKKFKRYRRRLHW